MRERVADDLGLLVDLLGHEVAKISLVDEKGRSRRSEHGPLDLAAFAIADLDAGAREHHRVTILEIGNHVGKRREGDRVGTEVHFAVTVPDRERRALARADEEIVLAREQKGERERTAQPRQRSRHGFRRRAAVLHLPRDQMGDHLGIGIGAERRARFLQLLAELAEILDDAVVDDGEALGSMRVRVMFGRSTVSRPARVADADRAGERLAREPGFEIAKLALGTPARKVPGFERGDTGRIIAAIFEPLERVDQQARDRFAAENSYNSAHASGSLLTRWPRIIPPAWLIGGQAQSEIKLSLNF